MRIAITGTPGTGKSALARRLRALGEKVIALNDVAFKHRFLGPYDRKRRTTEVDLGRLQDFLDRDLPAGGRLFLEGHYSHLLEVDRAIVLRCDPPVLRRRLSRRGYPKAKVRENSLAEVIDSITVEAVGKLGKERVIELDTTHMRQGGLASLVLGLAKKGFRHVARYRPGRIDFSEDIIRNPNYYSGR